MFTLKIKHCDNIFNNIKSTMYSYIYIKLAALARYTDRFFETIFE